jgi:lysyl-tRNA synthetase class 2
MPEEFLRHLSQGLPPSAGVAVGLDRLLMLKLGTQDIADVIALSGFD